MNTSSSPLTESGFIAWLISRGYAVGAFSNGHTGRNDAWTKTYTKDSRTFTVRYFVTSVYVAKETSIGFSAFSRAWKKPLSSLTISTEGKLASK